MQCQVVISNCHMALIPGFAIILTVLGLNLMGDGLRDYLDPRLRVTRV